MRVQLTQSRQVHEEQPLGHASEATPEIVGQGDWDKLHGALDEWVADARRRGKPPAEAIVRNGRTLVGRRTVKQPTAEFWMDEGSELVLARIVA